MDAGYTAEGKGAEWVERVVGQAGGSSDRPREVLFGAEVRSSTPRHWVVERTFSWLSQKSRMSNDYERLPESSEAFIYVAMSRLMARRLARS